MKTKKAATIVRKKKAATIVHLDELPELLTPEEAKDVLRVSRNGMYELLKSGAVPHLKYGRLIRIRKSVLLEGGK